MLIPLGAPVAALLVLAGCGSPADRFEAAAASAGLLRSQVEGAGFRHAVFANDAPPTGALRVYIDGDGAPYLGKAIAADPTPQQSLALALLAADHGPALYLGRPCYHRETRIGSCTSELWTRARYGETVVASMAAAVQSLIAGRGVRTVTFVGHSGGGTLAMLIARRIAETRAVVTIAANLDVAGWARYARQDLSGSLDPAVLPPLHAGIHQRHYRGGRDRVVPPASTAAALASPLSVLTIIDDFDHVCCWTRMWPKILAELDAAGDVSQHNPRSRCHHSTRMPSGLRSRRRSSRSSRSPGSW